MAEAIIAYLKNGHSTHFLKDIRSLLCGLNHAMKKMPVEYNIGHSFFFVTLDFLISESLFKKLSPFFNKLRQALKSGDWGQVF